jgi:hypothetical protein
MDAYLEAREVIVQQYHLQPLGDKAFESELRRLISKIA